MTITSNPPRSRAPRRVSVLFATLENHSTFWFPTRKGALVKTSFCTARSHDGWFFVNPFRSVLVKAMSKALMKALCAPSPFIGIMERAPFPVNMGETITPGPVGHPSPGHTGETGALGEPGLIGPIGIAGALGPDDSGLGGCCGGNCPCNRPRGDEPHNDNNITGPTC